MIKSESLQKCWFVIKDKMTQRTSYDIIILFLTLSFLLRERCEQYRGYSRYRADALLEYTIVAASVRMRFFIGKVNL